MPQTLRALLLATAFALLVTQTAASAEDEFRIGLIVCLTGECASDGVGTSAGAQLAADEINASGGVLGRKIKLVAQDTAESVSGAKAITAYQQLRLDKAIAYLIGPSWSPAGLSLGPIVARDNVIITTPSLGMREFHEAGDNIFNIRGVDEAPTRRIAAVTIKKGWKRAAVFSSEQAWESLQGKVFAAEFERLGGKIVAHVEPLPTTTMLSSEALRIVAAKPEVIFFSNTVQMAPAAKELRKLGWSGQKLAANMDDVRRNEAQRALDGTLFMSFPPPSPEFSKKFEQRFRRKPELPASTGYDTVYVYAKAIQAANTFDPAVVKKEILKVTFTGASGEIRFDEQGCVQKAPRLWKATKEGFVEVGI